MLVEVCTKLLLLSKFVNSWVPSSWLPIASCHVSRQSLHPVQGVDNKPTCPLYTLSHMDVYILHSVDLVFKGLLLKMPSLCFTLPFKIWGLYKPHPVTFKLKFHLKKNCSGKKGFDWASGVRLLCFIYNSCEVIITHIKIANTFLLVIQSPVGRKQQWNLQYSSLIESIQLVIQ